jgi:hypothetical protein
MLQFYFKVAWLLLLLFAPFIYADNRFDISNKVTNGFTETGALSIYDEQDITPQSLLIGVDSNLGSINSIQNDWKKLLQKSKCTNKEFQDSYEYIRYLFFLTRLTVNYEILLDYRENASFINIPFCSVEFDSLRKSCRPKSKDMKKFLNRLGYYLQGRDQKELNKYVKLSDSMLKKLPTMDKEEFDSSTLFTLNQACGETNNCSVKNTRIFKSLQLECKRRKKQFISSCSEDESQFAKIISSEMVNLIKRSSAIEYIKKFDASSGCVDRFFRNYSKLNRVSINNENEAIRTVMRAAQRLNIPYLQGRLFVIGSLKEFDELGVGNDIFEEIRVAKKEVSLPKVKKVKEIIAEAPRNSKNILKKVIKKVSRNKKKKSQRLSSLKMAYQEINRRHDSIVALDMDHFKNDYTFSNSALIKLHKPLGNFQKRKSLDEMKRFDKLGEKKAPMRLLFLKYLIDNNYHQGLYNVVAVLGKSFYVKNDLEKGDAQLYKMSLRNNEYTNNVWQLFLFRK